MTVLPKSCIRGPELHDATVIAAELHDVEAAALAAYADGVALLQKAHALLAAQTQLEQARRTRAFLIAQLVSVERRDTALFDAALKRYQDSSHPKERPCPPPEALPRPD